MSPDQPGLVTLAEATGWLDPPVSRQRLSMILLALQIRPAGSRPQGRGHPVATYDMHGDLGLQALHAALTPWLVASEAHGRDLGPGHRV